MFSNNIFLLVNGVSYCVELNNMLYKNSTLRNILKVTRRFNSLLLSYIIVTLLLYMKTLLEGNNKEELSF